MADDKEVGKASSDPMTYAIEKARPIIAKLSLGSVVGYCSGYTIKKLGQVAVVIIGAGYIAVQTCASYGYLSVNWEKVRDDAIKQVDTTGDGKLDANDVKVYWQKLKALLTSNLPNSTGFSLGFFYGIQG